MLVLTLRGLRPIRTADISRVIVIAFISRVSREHGAGALNCGAWDGCTDCSRLGGVVEAGCLAET